MLRIELELEKYANKGEKTAWTFAKIIESLAQELKPDNKRSFRVKGQIDNLDFKQLALIPIGKGDFILPVNGQMRKKLKKESGQKVILHLTIDNSELELSDDLIACLEDEPSAYKFFKTLTKSHQRYFSNWIESAKTIETKTKRISNSLFGLANGMEYGEMVRHFKAKR